MSFRRRLTIAGTTAVAIAVVLACGIAFTVVRAELRGQVDDSLRSSADDVGGDVVFMRAVEPAVRERTGVRDQPHVVQRQLVAPAPLSGPARYAQLVWADGSIVPQPGGGTRLPVTEQARRLAKRGEGSFFSDQTVDGVHVRVFTRALGGGQALQVARPVEEVDSAIERLGLILAAVGVGGVGLAGALGLVVTRTATQPVRAMSDAAEHVARTRDLSRRIQAEGDDELSRLAGSFNTMLEALDRSMHAQRRLVADASHELRTPLTSLRTNVELLATANGLPPDERRAMLTSITGQLEELSALVADLVDLARDPPAGEEPAEAVALDALVGAVVERASRLHPGRAFSTQLEPSVVTAAPGKLARAVGNLIDNAHKWSPEGTAVEVSARRGCVVVRDHGPGIDGSDLPHVFDRFYRAPSARATAGSGLGLAIVKQVADAYGGSVSAENAPGGGARLRLELPADERGS